jgi:hypothetical protein
MGLILATMAVYGQGGRGGGGRGPGGNPAGAGSGPQAPPPATDCAASGTVVNANTGEPIPRAMVSLGGAGASGSATDATGRWTVTNAICGPILPSATRPGFIPSNQGPGFAVAMQKRTVLVSGSPLTNLKISLMPEGVVAGKVQDSYGDPMENVQVRVMRVNIQEGKHTLNNMGGGAVDALGNFRIGGLRPGHYFVCAWSRQVTYPIGGGDAMVYAESCYPGPPASGLTTGIPIEAGREIRTAFTLTAVRGVHVRGSVSGFPAMTDRGPRVSVQLMQSNGGGGQGGQVKPDGTFDIPTVAPGQYIARATLPQAGASGPGIQIQALADVQVGDSDVNDVTLTAQSPGSLSGTVRFEFTNPATAASPPVDVNLAPPTQGPNFFAGPIPRAQWDSSHTSFELTPVPAGQFRFNAYAGGQGVYVKSATIRGQDVLNQPLTVNGATGPVEIVVSDDTGSIDVTVNDRDGHPVAAAVLLVSQSGQQRFLNSGDDGHATNPTMPTGEYRAWAFDNLNTVPYAEEDWMAQNAGSGEKVSVTSMGSANITLTRIAAPSE